MDQKETEPEDWIEKLKKEYQEYLEKQVSINKND